MRAMRLAALAAFGLAAGGAHATVFDDAYQCLKANANMVLVTAETGPKAVQFVVTQPQCVAMVTSPAPVPTVVMVGTLGLTATGVLPKTNPACEGALYTSAAKPVASILDKAGILPGSVKKMLADQAANEAIGAAVQAIPGASVAFASFSCGCGLSDVGLNPDKVKQVYNAVVASGNKCGAILANLMEGGSEAIVKGVSNAGDLIAGQSTHMHPDKYYDLVFKPRLNADFETFSQWNFLEVHLYKTVVPQCEHYFDKHTMSATNANSTCIGLTSRYLKYFIDQSPILAEKRAMANLREGKGGEFFFGSDKMEPFGTYCAVAAKAVYPSSMPAENRYLTRCMVESGAFLGFEVKRDPAYSSTNRYLVKKVAQEKWTTRIMAAANNPGGRKSSQLVKDTSNALFNEWKPLETQKRAAWKADISAELAKLDGDKQKSDAAFADKNKKDAEAKKAADAQAMTAALAQLTAPCKDERCKVETAEFVRSCKPVGSEGQVMNGQIACDQNKTLHIDGAVLRAGFQQQLGAQVRGLTSVVCPANMDCATGVERQRAEIDAAANAVWDYIRAQGLARGAVSGAKAAILQEANGKLAPVAARRIVAENKPRTLTANVDPRTVPPAVPPPASPPIVAIAPPKPPVTTAPPPVATMPPKFTPPPPTVVANTPPKPPVTTVPPPVATMPPTLTPPPPPVVANTPPKPPVTVPPPVVTAPPKLTPPPTPVVAQTPPRPPVTVAPTVATLPPKVTPPVAPPSIPAPQPMRPPTTIGSSVVASAAVNVAGCTPKSERESSTLACTDDAALNRCRSLIASGKVRGCELRR